MPLFGEPATTPVDAFATLPDPAEAGGLDDLVEQLRQLKVWAGDPSYESIKDRVNAAWTAAGRPAAELTRKSTVAYCFRPGRRRLNTDLLIAVVQALHPDTGYIAQWRQALRVIGGETEAASRVRVHDDLPPDLTGFTGRASELDQLRHAAQAGDAVVISAIEGMAGVGKTQLAVHAGHLLTRENALERVLFVNLRGFHPDPDQPPADPAAVLDGFLRLLGMPGQQIPHGLAARTAAYRDRLAGTRTLVVLDNAAEEDQVRPLLPRTPGCLTLITSRRALADLRAATHLTLHLFTHSEAVGFVTRAASEALVGPDPDSAARIVRRCGYLPLALGLVAGQIRARPGWSLADHADRLDERHRDRRLDNGVELAFDLSYQHLSTAERRLLRLAALHPGEDFDAYAAAALSDTDLATTETHLRRLSADHLLQAAAGRYSFHDLVHAYAATRAVDEDAAQERRAALTRLFDHYLAAAAAAADSLYPAEAGHRPRVAPVATPPPDLTDPDAARAWLDGERPALVAVAAYTATRGWPSYTTRLSATLFRYLAGGHHTDALNVHDHARRAARRTGDLTAEADALIHLGGAHFRLGRHQPATDHFSQALTLYRQAGDQIGQARALGNLGLVEERMGRYRAAAQHSEMSLSLYRQAGDRPGEARALGNLALVEEHLGRHQAATDRHQQALTLFRDSGDRVGEADTLTNLGDAEVRIGRYSAAAEHLQRALTLFRSLGDVDGEAWTLVTLGNLHTRLGDSAQATQLHRRALAMFRDNGILEGEAWALNGIGEAAHAAGDHEQALTHHTAALSIATDLGLRDQEVRGHTGLARVHHVTDDDTAARRHYERALHVGRDTPEFEQIRAELAALDALARNSGACAGERPAGDSPERAQP